MAREIQTKARGGAKRLTATMVPTLSPGEHTDPATRGLQLRVEIKRRTGETVRTWLFRYEWRGTHARLTIGHVPTMSLAQARERVFELRRKLDEGIDPRRAMPRRRAIEATPPSAADAAPVAPHDQHTVDFLVREFVQRFLRPNRKRPKYAEDILT